MKQLIFLTLINLLATASPCQNSNPFAGVYINTTSAYSSILLKNGKWQTAFDTMILVLDKDMTFYYKVIPASASKKHKTLITTGTWLVKEGKAVLNSTYQREALRVFEYYRQEYGDSMIKVRIEADDSALNFFRNQYVTLSAGSKTQNYQLIPDSSSPDKARSLTFTLLSTDKTGVRCGTIIGLSEAIAVKDSRSNYFIIQYNLSPDRDYRYFRDFELSLTENAVIHSEKEWKTIFCRVDKLQATGTFEPPGLTSGPLNGCSLSRLQRRDAPPTIEGKVK